MILFKALIKLVNTVKSPIYKPVAHLNIIYT